MLTFIGCTISMHSMAAKVNIQSVDCLSSWLFLDWTSCFYLSALKMRQCASFRETGGSTIRFSSRRWRKMSTTVVTTVVTSVTKHSYSTIRDRIIGKVMKPSCCDPTVSSQFYFIVVRPPFALSSWRRPKPWRTTGQTDRKDLLITPSVEIGRKHSL